jgi:RNA polymerase sigma-70 factor (ECF subfamily)
MSQLTEPTDFDARFQMWRGDIYGFVDRRLNSKLRRRLDPSDVVQETHLAAFRRYEEFLRHQPMPFRIWLLRTAQQQLIQAYRVHLVTAKRSVEREVAWSDRSSILLAQGMAVADSSPSKVIGREELVELVRTAVESLQDLDREILLMRHIENRPYEEIALLLEIQPDNARQRCGRALIKLRKIMSELGLIESDDGN